MRVGRCPYCHGIKNILLGHVYCSLQGGVMGDARTGFLTIRSQKLEETSDHVSRLSIRCTSSGEQHYKVGGNDHLVTPANYLLINQGQFYRTSFEAEKEQEMTLVAFQPGFAEGLLYSLNTRSSKLLDAPYDTLPEKVNFFEHTYEADPVIKNIFGHLQKVSLLHNDIKKEMDLEAVYTTLLTRIFETQGKIRTDIDRLQATKLSTRTELYRRLSVARDFIDANINEKLTLEQVASAACLSVHHFKREFKALYGCSPHKYLSQQRIARAEVLLGRAVCSLEQVADACGFENVSSFIRLFRQETGYTPGVYRQRLQFR